MLLTSFLTLLFVKIRILDIVDILLVAVLLYEFYNLVKGTVATNIFIGVVGLYLLWKLVRVYEMELLSEILGQFISIGVLALVIVFQQEIRQFLLMLGNPEIVNKGSRSFFGWFRPNTKEIMNVEPIINACESMSKTYTGALIVISRKNELKSYIETGEEIDAKISELLITNIFYKNSPLHDGALIITGNLLKAARCVLPVSDITDFPVQLGLRHRAALGISQQSDAIAIIVSEQTGEISCCIAGKLSKNIGAQKLKKVLEEQLIN